MSNRSTKQLRRTFERVQRRLNTFNMNYDQNQIELVLATNGFDFEKTVDAFKNGDAEAFLSEWKFPLKKSQPKEFSITLTPINTKTKSTKVSSSPVTPSARDLYVMPGEKHASSLACNQITHEIENCAESIKNYESKMECCDDENLRKYYIEAALRDKDKILVLENRRGKIFDIDLFTKFQYLSTEVQHLSKSVHLLIKQNKDNITSKLDCWESSSARTKEEQDEFKNRLIHYYRCGSTNSKTIKCMVMSKYFDRSLVRASHIWKASTRGIGLTAFKLQEIEVNHERNGLLLFESIERAFDLKKLCFIYDPFVGVLRVKILCPELRNVFIVADERLQEKFCETRTFANIDNNMLNLPDDIYPYRRLLNWHGRCSYNTAKLKNWIHEEEHFEDFFYLSDLISLPGDELEE